MKCLLNAGFSCLISSQRHMNNQLQPQKEGKDTGTGFYFQKKTGLQAIFKILPRKAKESQVIIIM